MSPKVWGNKLVFEPDNTYVAKGRENKLACLNLTKIMSPKVGEISSSVQT
jgi:hypothetical protein